MSRQVSPLSHWEFQSQRRDMARVRCVVGVATLGAAEFLACSASTAPAVAIGFAAIHFGKTVKLTLVAKSQTILVAWVSASAL